MGTAGRCSLQLWWCARNRAHSHPWSSSPDHQVVLAKPFILPQDSLLGCTGSLPPAQGLLLSPSTVLRRDRGAWRDVGHTAMQFPISEKIWGEGGSTLGGFQASLGHLAATTTTQGTLTPLGCLSACAGDTTPGFTACGGPGGSRSYNSPCPQCRWDDNLRAAPSRCTPKLLQQGQGGARPGWQLRCGLKPEDTGVTLWHWLQTPRDTAVPRGEGWTHSPKHLPAAASISVPNCHPVPSPGDISCWPGTSPLSSWGPQR